MNATFQTVVGGKKKKKKTLTSLINCTAIQAFFIIILIEFKTPAGLALSRKKTEAFFTQDV